MRNRSLFALTAVLMSSLASTCNRLDSPCSLPVVPDPGVVVTLSNSATLQLIPGADLTLFDGVLTHEMEEIAPAVYGGANGIPGNFTLTVEADDFQTVTVEDIVVTGEPCDVMTVELQIELNPL
jgi:hypothetical protein